MLVFLDHVARIVAQPLGFCERIDQWLGLDSQEALFKALVEEAVAGFAYNEVCNLVEIGGCKVPDDFVP